MCLANPDSAAAEESDSDLLLLLDGVTDNDPDRRFTLLSAVSGAGLQPNDGSALGLDGGGHHHVCADQ